MSHHRSRRAIRRMLSFSNVCSLLALVIALGTGSALAANTIFSTDIVDGQVQNVDLAGNAVNTDKIAGSAVHADDIASGAVTAPKLAPASVTSPAIAKNA